MPDRCGPSSGAQRRWSTRVLGVSIASALSSVHRAGLVYGALSPDSVLIDRSGAAYLADLERVSDVEAETSPLLLRPGRDGPHVFVARADRSRESCCRRAERPVLPRPRSVRTGDRVAALHRFVTTGPGPCAHRPPATPPRNSLPGCATLVVDLVDRLLCKHPEDRYATAAAVADDLRAIADDIAAGRTPGVPARASRRRTSTAALRRVVRARQRAGRASRCACERGSGRTELAFVSGFSGIGKSRLVNELQRPVAAADGWFATGKFDLYRRTSRTRRSSKRLGSSFVRCSRSRPSSSTRSSTRLTEEMRASAAALTELIPDLQLVIGEQVPPGEVSPAEAQRRLEAGIGTLVRVVLSVEHPLVLFIDDLQWSDLASLRLLDVLIAEVAASALLVIVAWRDNEVGPGHLAWDFVQRNGGRAVSLVLEPLGVDDVTNWVAVSLHEKTDVVKDLARLTHDKTLGNPFFVRQFLQDLMTDDLLRVDASGTWSWDDTAVDRRSVSENVGILVSRQVARLPSGVREILQAASCVGPEFDLDSVVSIVGGDRDAAVSGLHAALRSGLVLPCDDTYQYASGDGGPASTLGSRSSTIVCRRSLTSRCRPQCAPRATWRSPVAAWRTAIPIRTGSTSCGPRRQSPVPRSTSSTIRWNAGRRRVPARGRRRAGQGRDGHRTGQRLPRPRRHAPSRRSLGNVCRPGPAAAH